MNKAGVTIALGDDTGIQNSFPGYASLQQMERMAESGDDASASLSSRSRERQRQVLRIADMGSIAAGKQASFIVLDANPLDHLANARKISQGLPAGTGDRPPGPSENSGLGRVRESDKSIPSVAQESCP